MVCLVSMFEEDVGPLRHRVQKLPRTESYAFDSVYCHLINLHDVEKTIIESYHAKQKANEPKHANLGCF